MATVSILRSVPGRSSLTIRVEVAQLSIDELSHEQREQCYGANAPRFYGVLRSSAPLTHAETEEAIERAPDALLAEWEADEAAFCG